MSTTKQAIKQANKQVKQARKQVQKAAKATEWNPMRVLNVWGVRSSHAYTLGLISVGFAILSRISSRGKDDEKARSDHRGLFVGQWAPTFFALGVGLKLEENS